MEVIVNGPQSLQIRRDQKRSWLRRNSVPVVFLALSCGFVTDAAADVIVLTTGEILRGKIVEQNGTALEFAHPILGNLEIQRGDVVDVRLGDDADGTPQKNTIQSDSDGVDSTSASDTSVGDGAENVEKDSSDVAAPEEPAADVSPWQATLEFGINGSEGNTQTIDGRAAFTLSRDLEHMRTQFDASWFYGQARGDRTTNRLTAGGRNDWKMPESRWFLFAQARYDFDEFQSWDYRASGGGGFGYELIKSDEFDLIARAGAGVKQEFGSDDESIVPEAILGLDASWRIAENQTFTAAATLHPNLEDINDYRLIMSADWSIVLDAARGIDFKLGVYDEYESMTDPGILNNDFKFYGTLVFRF